MVMVVRVVRPASLSGASGRELCGGVEVRVRQVDPVPGRGK